MAGAAAPLAVRIESGTPVERDRFLDFVRAASILGVVLGHWLITQYVMQGGTIELTSALGAAPYMWPVSWLLMVIPLFFFVGGYANRRSWLGTRRRGEGYAAFVDHRLHRLLTPTLLLLAVVTAGAGVQWLTGSSGLGAGGRIEFQPLWFVGVYAAVIALTPVSLAAYARWGWGSVAALAASVVVVDVVRLRLGWTPVGYLNVILVWTMAHQLGYAYGDGSFTRARAWLLAVGGFATVSGVVAWGPYPARMVSVPGDRLANMYPPTVAVAALALGEIGVTVLLRPPLTRMLQRPRVWVAVVAVNASIMSIYLWHQTAQALVARLGLPIGLPQPRPGTPSWWASRPLWFVLAGVVLAVLVRLVSRAEHVAPPAPVVRSPVTSATAVVAVVLVALGMLTLAGSDATSTFGLRRLLGAFDVSALMGLAGVAVAWLALRVARAGVRPLRLALAGGGIGFAVISLAYAVGIGGLPVAPRAATAAAAMGLLVVLPAGLRAVPRAARAAESGVPPRG